MIMDNKGRYRYFVAMKKVNRSGPTKFKDKLSKLIGDYNCIYIFCLLF